MDDQAKLERMLRFIMLLSNNVGYSIPELARRMEKSERTVRRYLETFKNTGFVITQTNGYYKIDKNEGWAKDLSDLLHFSEEEAHILSKAIQSIDDNNVLKNNLIHKLYSLYDFDRVVDAVVKKEYSETVHALHEAMRNKHQVILKNYSSSNSGSISDRLAEPFKFTANYISAWCFEVTTKKNKIFKTGRIGKVIKRNTPWQYEDQHESGFIDPFRNSGKRETTVKIQLSMRARNLMIEEYPLTENYILPAQKSKYVYEGPVCKYEGIGRFVLGLPGEVEVHAPEGFIKWLERKKEKY